MNKNVLILTAISVMAAVSAGAYYITNMNATAEASQPAQATVTTENGKQVKSFEVVAKEVNWELNDETKIKAMTYGGSVPGSQIRVQQGDMIRVTLKNELDVPTTIHWHGYPLPNSMDGIPGQTQDAVAPGASFTYEFEAKVPGTYWYHSHQDSANQADRGLYGTLIVEEKDVKKTDKEYTLVLDEWNPAMFASSGGGMDHSGHGSGQSTDSNSGGMDHSKMNHGSSTSGGMDHSSMNHGSAAPAAPAQSGHAGHDQAAGTTSGGHADHSTQGQAATPATGVGAIHDQMMRDMYSIYTVNGKSGASIEPLDIKKGETVRLRFVNAGFQKHVIRLHGQPYKIISTDGQPINNPALIEDSPFIIAPGERYDIEFTASVDHDWKIESLDETEAAKGMLVPVKVNGQPAPKVEHDHGTLPIDITNYGQAGNALFSADTQYQLTYKMTLGEKEGANKEAQYTINGQTAPNIPPLQVKTGDKIKVTFQNVGTSNHPMHLHGHFFQVLSKNGKAITGAPLMKDTLNVAPGESYEVAFVADNPGDWMFHCHDLHHAAAGMVSEVKYQGYKSFVPDPNAGNNPH
ncbi:multicopper oxidase family protein [Brevibacillus dissolubilis]|uniref:multicopper oxidase family protein n=1 Tax=Brevibacillus dissolubilis TaxID=1844116 RepID=UPI001116215D|nr:multicopper oxidase family protein [Brevibacillus dissolubilis]